jgi:hypothetical protein
MLVDDAGILDGHVPAAKRDHAGAVSEMSSVKRSAGERSARLIAGRRSLGHVVVPDANRRPSGPARSVAARET